MKSIHRPPSFPRQALALPLLPGRASALAVLAAIHPVLAVDVNLTATNGFGTSSFASALSWSNAAAPAAGNAYFVPSTLTLRTPAGSAAGHVFAGDSLTLTGANFVYKGITNVNTVTINNLTLDGSLVNNASDSSTAFILDGTGITIAGTGTSTLFSNNATITVNAPIGGNSGTLLLQTNNTLGRQVILAGANTYTGNITVTGASGAVLSSTGKLAFALGTSGAYNTITGTVPFTFDGVFTIDLTGASTTVGDSYPLVNTATLAETFGPAFAVEDWVKIATAWVSPDGNYQFHTSTGVLVRVETDSDLDGLPDNWEVEHFTTLEASDGDDDPDLDYCNNLEEYAANTDPEDFASFPDVDFDGLPDGWETLTFGNMAQLGSGDPDGDYSTNEAEFVADSNPTDRSSFPDSDNDLISDGWEEHFFITKEACVAGVDDDLDLFNNKWEFDEATVPTNLISSPDTDPVPDTLPDGWEVKYFRVGDEPLLDAIAHTDGTTDSDADGRSDLVEYHEGTNPLVAETAPPTVAYWRFEENTAGAVAFPQVAGAVKDVSGKGNDMLTYADYTAPAYSTRAFDGNVTNTGAMNRASLAFVEVDGNRYTSDNIYTSGTAPINTTVFSALTVEASFRTTRSGRAQGIIGKTGNPTGMAAPYQAPFTLKLNAANQVVAGLIDAADTVREVASTRTITAGAWHSTAVTVSPTTLSLWLKVPGDTEYQLEASVPVSGAWSTTEFNRAWVTGQTEYNPAANGGFGGFDSFTGDLDEIRISSKVLPTGQFLANIASNAGDTDLDDDGLDDAWEEANFGAGNFSETAAGDYDVDGTSNLAEFLLGLEPDDGTSFFAGSLSGATLTWPAAAGLSFTVQRSTTLGSWDNVATVVANGATGSWTDLTPPAGKAFYRVVLAE